MKPRPVELHIQELVLHGFASGDRHLIAEAVKRELTRSFHEQGVPPSLLRNQVRGRVDGGAFTTTRVVPADAVGGQIAQAVYGGLR